MKKSEGMMPPKEIEKRCYYSDVKCWRTYKPDEGSTICTNCLLAKTLAGFHPELMQKEKVSEKPNEKRS